MDENRDSKEVGWLDIKGAARYTSTSVRGMYQRVAKGQVPYAKWGSSLRFSRKALDDLLRGLEVHGESR